MVVFVQLRKRYLLQRDYQTASSASVLPINEKPTVLSTMSDRSTDCKTVFELRKWQAEIGTRRKGKAVSGKLVWNQY